jgi:hypothetical protein
MNCGLRTTAVGGIYGDGLETRLSHLNEPGTAKAISGSSGPTLTL